MACGGHDASEKETEDTPPGSPRRQEVRDWARPLPDAHQRAWSCRVARRRLPRGTKKKRGRRLAGQSAPRHTGRLFDFSHVTRFVTHRRGLVPRTEAHCDSRTAHAASASLRRDALVSFLLGRHVHATSAPVAVGALAFNCCATPWIVVFPGIGSRPPRSVAHPPPCRAWKPSWS